MVHRLLTLVRLASLNPQLFTHGFLNNFYVSETDLMLDQVKAQAVTAQDYFGLLLDKC